ncbi:FecR family protein [Sphingobacterium sp. BN32]|uniref:FecR family protein n=1 Tax=Sphingobacterium sp. BN32 TaxID=3058432 RepID=UPI00265D2891|nr:FecR domain-containing protein [Sphingobacterium sp. BN32]WKK59064.1 FecR domain-containing protein [Sphingobacterium sp. BN32]
MNVNNYNNHTTEADLLRDDFFIRSMLAPTEETERFWQQVLLVNNLSEEVFEGAKQKLLQPAHSMNQHAKDALFSQITESTHTRVRKISYYRYAAAAILLVLGISFALFRYQSNEVPVKELAEKSQADTSGILLVTGDGETVNIEGKEAVLDFSNANAVTVNKKKLEVARISQAVQHEVRVPVGKRISLILSDGTKMWVNAGSIVKFPSHFDKKQREVSVDGEVYADVVKNPKKPFVFHTKEFNVQVLGTSLNIHAYSDDPNQQVTLVEGKVKVKSSQGEHFLKPDESYFADGKTEEVREVDVTFFTSWKDGFYRFKDQQLKDVIQNLERYYGTDIECSPKIAKMTCSGYLDLKDDINMVLRGVAFSMDIKFKKEESSYKLYQ